MKGGERRVRGEPLVDRRAASREGRMMSEPKGAALVAIEAWVIAAFDTFIALAAGRR